MLHVGSGSGTSRRNVGACRVALAGVAAALLGWSGEPVRAQGVPPPSCSVSPLDGSVVDCTGDLSSGVELNDGAGPFRSLNVFDLTADIAPPVSSGIVFTSDGNVTLNVDAGPFRIVTTADDAIGVFGGSVTGNVSINSRADITTFGDFAPGIAVIADSDAAVVSTGNITTTGDASDGIQVMSMFGTALAVSFGDISATGTWSAGIYASGDSDAIVMNFGSVIGGPCCAGVIMDAFGLNTLINFGTITAGLNDFAIDLLGAVDNVVENFGTVTGDVSLSDGFGPQGTFFNHAGAAGPSDHAAEVHDDGVQVAGRIDARRGGSGGGDVARGDGHGRPRETRDL